MQPKHEINHSTARRDRFVLANGLTVVFENAPQFSSVALALWLPVGSRDESPEQGGASHLLEHLLFKGTTKRTYREISRAIEKRGGELNAATGRETTQYFVQISHRHRKIALDVLSDMFFSSTLPSEEFEDEKKVILEEIRMGEDIPEEYALDLFYLDAFGQSPLGRPITGTTDSLAQIERENLMQFYQDRYHPTNGVLSIAGQLYNSASEKEELIADIESYFTSNARESRLNTAVSSQPAQWNGPKQKSHHKDLEQVHLLMGLPGEAKSLQNQAHVSIFTHALGGNSSARLFLSLREERGLCYNVHSFHHRYRHEGLWGIYAATSPKNREEVETLIKQEFEDALLNMPIEELNDAKESLMGLWELAMEATSSQADYNASSELYFGETPGWQREIDRLAHTPVEETLSYIQDLWRTTPWIQTALEPEAS